MRVIGYWFVVAIFLIAAGRVTLAERLRLTMDEAVAHATAANLEFGANRKDLDVARASLQRSQSLFPSNPFLGIGGQHAPGFSPNYSLLLSQEIEVGGQRSRRVGAAQADVERATWEAKSLSQNLEATVKTAFMHALISAERVTLAKRNADAAAELAKHIPGRESQTGVQRIEANNVLIQDARARREVAAAQQAYDSALLGLRRLMGLPLDQEVDLVGVPQSSIRDLPPTAELVAHALEQRPDLVALRHSAEHGALQLSVAQREAIPNVTISGNVSRFEGSTLVGGDLGVPLPIWQRKRGDIEEAVAERERTGLEVRNLERQIQKEVIEARQACSVAADDLRAQQTEIGPRSEENLHIEQRLYERGDVDLSDLIGVAIDTATARRDYLDALETYNNSLIELERVSAGGFSLT